jgi:deazaflavin-dependent oxidoreductase (nitroreductase family)
VFVNWREGLADAGFKTMNLSHRAILWVSGGRAVTSFSGMPVVQLGVVGRKSGVRRTTLLTAPVFDDQRVVLIGSKGGDNRDPDWFRNVVANPDVDVTVLGTGETRQLRARVASPEEKAELWPKIVAVYQGYAGYQKRTGRDIPVVICESRTA